jgi:hypothetical protein
MRCRVVSNANCTDTFQALDEASVAAVRRKNFYQAELQADASGKGGSICCHASWPKPDISEISQVHVVLDSNLPHPTRAAPGYMIQDHKSIKYRRVYSFA